MLLESYIGLYIELTSPLRESLAWSYRTNPPTQLPSLRVPGNASVCELRQVVVRVRKVPGDYRLLHDLGFEDSLEVVVQS